MKKNICLFLSAIIFIQECLGSSCCGSSISMPAMITTGEKWKLQTVFSESKRVFQITPDSSAVKLSSRNQLDTFKTQIKAGYRFTNEWQVFAQVSQFDRGAGDMNVGFGKELFLSEDFKTFVWMQLSIPTGKSIYEMKSGDDEPTGSGFYTPGIGASISKAVRTWDYSASAYVGQGFTRKINGSTINPGLQSFAQVAAGKNYGDWRIGASLEHQREEGKKVVSKSKAEDSYSWPVTVSLSYLNKGDIWTASLTDETLLGPTQNTYLNRGIAVSFVRRFF